MALAEREGAAGLLEAVGQGGEAERVALAALPYAVDADAALGVVCERATSEGGGARVIRLESVLAMAGRPRDQREALDPDGARACFAALVAFARRRDAPPEERALAVSAARALAEKGHGLAADVPVDLDPR